VRRDPHFRKYIAASENGDGTFLSERLDAEAFMRHLAARFGLAGMTLDDLARLADGPLLIRRACVEEPRTPLERDLVARFTGYVLGFVEHRNGRSRGARHWYAVYRVGASELGNSLALSEDLKVNVTAVRAACRRLFGRVLNEYRKGGGHRGGTRGYARRWTA